MGLQHIIDREIKVVNPHKAVQKATLKIREIKVEPVPFNNQHLIVSSPTAILPYIL